MIRGKLADEAAVIRAYTVEMLSQAAVAQRFGCSPMLVNKFLKVRGIPARSTSCPGQRNGMYGRTHTQDTVDKLREANLRQFARPGARERHAQLTVKQIQAGRTGKAYNKLEMLVATALAEAKIEFECQYSLGRYVYDFHVAKWLLLVEVNGTFWHSDPRFYDPTSLTAIQRKNRANDGAKTLAAITAGFRLAVLWEHDIENGLDVVQRITNEL